MSEDSVDEGEIPGLRGLERPKKRSHVVQESALSGVVLVAAAKAEINAIGRGLGVVLSAGLGDWEPHEVASGMWIVQSGVGKVNAAGATVWAIAKLRPRVVINLGICGRLPLDGNLLRIGSVVLASTSVYADEGLVSSKGFQTTAELGFPMGPFSDDGIPISSELREKLEPLADCVAPIATVSTCSGTDEQAHEVVRRTNALAEGMEGAAVGHVVAKSGGGTLFAELRVVSNTTGERARQVWDMQGSLERLAEVVGRVGRIAREFQA